MKKEDIEFLRELQHELNTQETDGQAAPRFWGIIETIKRPSPKGYGEPVFYTSDDCLSYNLEEFVQTIEENYLEDNESLKSLWEEIDKSDWDDVNDFALGFGIGIRIGWKAKEFSSNKKKNNYE